MRRLRQLVAMKRNDLRAKGEELAAALEALHSLGRGPPRSVMPRFGAGAVVAPGAEGTAAPPPVFAIVDAVSPESPAHVAGLLAGDGLACVGPLSAGATLPQLAALVQAHAGRPLAVVVVRPPPANVAGAAAPGAAETLALTLTPGLWAGGPGLLGCHVLPAPAAANTIR